MENTPKKKNAYKVATWILAGVVVVILVGLYFYLKANLVIVDKQDYEALQTKVQLQSEPQGKI